MQKKKEDTADQFALVQQKAVSMEEMLEEFQVESDEDLEAASDRIKQVKTLQKFIESEKDKFVAPAKAIIAEAREKYDPYIKKCQNAEEVLKLRAKKYMIAADEKRRASEAKIAAQVESGKIKPETAIKKMETLPEAQKTVRTDQGSALRMSKRKVARITDAALVPDRYWVIDEVLVRKVALALDKFGQEMIPGVIVEEETDLASF
jgi:hypothetical protein